ncbi:hypothetical protein FC756_18395 [Lysinibacillus mangiferihumi]|uniref:Uncharacterized protein n=1 Tax=Lysinibacillus mangiferihumi TaxID=1130819 RepID=A0A4U2YQB5_9BACI|nr:hypothetical protein [Lysinibacillus mangiferihumi]TKI63270.1 hypothetical protein FC756_18395 [Lysinibacillus mangiferihumi]
MKKFYMIFMPLSLVIITVLIIFSYKTDGENAKVTLESVVGNSLFKLLDNYEAIHSTKELSIDSIKEINVNLTSIEVTSGVIDLAVGQELLSPIANNLLKIMKDLENNYDQNKQFTEQDKEKYQKAITEIGVMISLIHEIYYVPNSKEGAEPKLKIENFGELKTVNNRLVED